MNYALAREIYGAAPWLADQHTLPALFGILDSMRSGVVLEAPSAKYNACEVVSLQGTKIIREPWQLDNKEEFEAVGLINLNGPITLAGGSSSFGIRQQAKRMQMMAADERIKSFIILADSGGGSSAAVEIMSDTILEVRKTKRVVGLIDEGGVAASACYGILSACDEIFAQSEMSIVGSVGTMVSFSGRPANTTDENGIRHVRIFATKSTLKNKAFEEAINNDNYELLTNNLLDPINERFLSLVVANRPMLEGTDFDNAHTVFAKDAVGTFIDGIKTFSEVLQSAAEGNKDKFNLKSETMTLEQMKSEHPDVYAGIFNAGVDAERDRAGAWMAHNETDPEAVKEGIESGESISATKREEFLVKGASLAHVKNLSDDSAKGLKEKEAKEDDEPSEVDAFYEDVKAKMNPVKS